ncbi:porin, partial [Burkholderia cenocepacia]
MKRTTLSLISLASFAAMPVAHAQSSVTLYGVIDTSITYVNHEQGKDNAWMLGNSSAGNLAGSRWGVKGTEDLGGGLKALF